MTDRDTLRDLRIHQTPFHSKKILNHRCAARRNKKYVLLTRPHTYRRKVPPVSESEPANRTRRAVDADVDPSTSKRRRARPAVTLQRRCVDTIGEPRPRDVELTEQDA